MLLGRDNPRDKFAKFLAVFGRDQVLSAFNGKNDMDINLRVGVGHGQNMPLQTELGNLFCTYTTNMSALRALNMAEVAHEQHTRVKRGYCQGKK